MPHPKIQGTDTPLRAIMSTLAALDCAVSLDNDRSLNALIDEVRDTELGERAYAFGT